MKSITSVFMLIFIIVSIPAAACSIDTESGYQWFMTKPWMEPSGVRPLAPKVKITISRGGRGSGFDCQGHGSIYFEFIEGNPRFITGYKFKVVGEGFEQGYIPESYVMALANSMENTVRFVFSEGKYDGRNPLNFTLELTAVSNRGMRSESTIIHVTHPGREPANK
jgi:hypothetical protein